MLYYVTHMPSTRCYVPYVSWLFGTRMLWHGGGLVLLSTAAFPLALLLIGNHDLAKGLAIGTLPQMLQ